MYRRHRVAHNLCYYRGTLLKDSKELWHLRITEISHSKKVLILYGYVLSGDINGIAYSDNIHDDVIPQSGSSPIASDKHVGSYIWVYCMFSTSHLMLTVAHLARVHSYAHVCNYSCKNHKALRGTSYMHLRMYILYLRT